VDLQHLEDYRLMMADKKRMTAFRRAIQITCPGRVVCEIGVGLGPLSLMALKAGAARVYGIEVNGEALDFATQVIRQHGFDPSRFIPIRGLSTRVTLPEKVDVILSETLDSMGFGENTVNYTGDASRRFLKRGGVLVPREVRSLVALASPKRYMEQLYFWQDELFAREGFDYQHALDILRSHTHVLPVTNEALFSDWHVWYELNLRHGFFGVAPAPTCIEVTKSGIIHGLACAFEAVLADGVVLRNLPEDETTHWHQGFNPFVAPMDLRDGELAYIELTIPEQNAIRVQFDMHVLGGPRHLVIDHMKKSA
jgi:predicted RNA methylase